MDDTNVAVKDSQFQVELNYAFNEIEQLSTLINDLESKLQVVLRNDPEDEIHTDDKSAVVQRAQQVRMITLKIIELSWKVSYILSNLEV